jgi:hypothetical protein
MLSDNEQILLMGALFVCAIMLIGISINSFIMYVNNKKLDKELKLCEDKYKVLLPVNAART